MNGLSQSLVHPDLQSDGTKAYAMESACLGSILIAADVCLPHLKFLKPEHFTLIANQYVYQAILDLASRGEGVELLTVVEELRVANRLSKLEGGYLYVSALINETGTYINVLTYANAIYEAWRKRTTLDLAGHIVQAALHSDTTSAMQIVSDMSKMLGQGYKSANPLKPYLIKADELKNLPTITWLVPGEIPEHGLITLFGPSGVGKSFYALDIALRLGQERTVIYIAAEGQAGYCQRVEAWCKFNNLSEGNLYFFMKDVSIQDDTERQQFTDLIKELNPCLVVVDTLAEAMAGYDENSTRDMTSFIRVTNHMKRELGCAVMFVHHTGKTGATERGNSSLRGSSDTMIRLIDDDDQIIVECSKQKDDKPFPTKYLARIEIEIAPGSRVPVLIPTSKREIGATDRPTERQLKVMKELGGEVLKDGATQGEIADASGLSPNSIYNVMKRMLQRKFATKRGEKYIITDQGRDMLRELDLLDYEPPKLNSTHQNSTKTQVREWQHDAKTQETQLFSDSAEIPKTQNSLESHEFVELLSFEQRKNSSRQKQRELLSLSSTAPTSCKKCGGSNFAPDPVWGWVCTDCRQSRQLDETSEG